MCKKNILSFSAFLLTFLLTSIEAQAIKAGGIFSLEDCASKAIKQSLTDVNRQQGHDTLALIHEEAEGIKEQQLLEQEKIQKSIIKKRKKVSATALLSAIASMCLHFSALLQASKSKDKQGQTEAIVNMAATALTFATECIEKEKEDSTTRRMTFAIKELSRETELFLETLTKSLLTTQTLNAYKNHEMRQQGSFIIAADSIIDREFQAAHDFGQKSIKLLVELIREKKPELLPMVKNLVTWTTHGDVIIA